jgi:mannitol/fructose-specific phosphotransferase system IIA component (Ntr-type)
MASSTKAEGRPGMRMTDFVIRDSIIPELAATTKEGVIRELVVSLGGTGYFKGSETEDIVRAVLKRELLGSTGIGRGVAIPHTKHGGVERLIGTVALSRPGVSFDSLDGEPVHVFVLLISPQDRPGDHLRALENVSRSLRDDGFVRSLRQATTREAVWDLLGELDHQAP